MGLRYFSLLAVPLLILAVLYFLGPISQPASYHDFADQRVLWQVPNYGDVASNLAYLIFGIIGLIYCANVQPPGAFYSWLAFFFGVTLVGVGSAYYHWAPTDESLIWDRLPMTVAFMAVYIALMSEFVARRIETFFLIPALVLGLGSVVFWAATGDLRLYFGRQALVFASAIIILASFQSVFGGKGYLVTAFGCYALGVIAEQFDHEIFSFTGHVVSGQTLKHILTGLTPIWVFLALRARQDLAPLRA